MREAPRILLGENPLKHTTADAESTPQQINDNAQHAYDIQDKKKRASGESTARAPYVDMLQRGSPIALKYSHLINSCFETLMQFADESDKNEEQQAHDRYSIPFQRYVWMTCQESTQRTKFNMNAHYCS